MIILLLLFWFILSGQISAFFIIAGFISLALTVYCDRKLFNDKISLFIGIKKEWLIYLLILFKEMIKSSIIVTRVIWFSSEVRPVWGTVNAQSSDPLIQVIQANSITLTPGTMSMDLSEGKILVHAISKETMDDVFVIPGIKK
jgi:multicomponent Na+:H+ antiporter subunit E